MLFIYIVYFCYVKMYVDNGHSYIHNFITYYNIRTRMSEYL